MIHELTMIDDRQGGWDGGVKSISRRLLSEHRAAWVSATTAPCDVTAPWLHHMGRELPVPDSIKSEIGEREARPKSQGSLNETVLA